MKIEEKEGKHVEMCGIDFSDLPLLKTKKVVTIIGMFLNPNDNKKRMMLFWVGNSERDFCCFVFCFGHLVSWGFQLWEKGFGEHVSVFGDV